MRTLTGCPFRVAGLNFQLHSADFVCGWSMYHRQKLKWYTSDRWDTGSVDTSALI
jgi:hypothetical protein